MSLKEELIALKKENLSKVSLDIQKIMFDDLEVLDASDIVAGAPKVGDRLKNFELTNQHGELRNLNQLRTTGSVVISFFRGGWCPYCNLELRAYQNVLPEVQNAGATLISITPELPTESLSTAGKNALDFDILTDANSDYARELGLVFTLSEEMRPVYEVSGVNIEKHNGNDQFDLPLAATFIVNVDGIITFAAVDVDYTLRAEPTDIVRELKVQR